MPITPILDTGGNISVTLPPTIGVGKYSIEVELVRQGATRRAFVKDAFGVVRNNNEAYFSTDTIDGTFGAEIGITYNFEQITDE